MKPFRERNPVIIGAVSIAVLVTMVLAALRADDLPLIGGGETYYANFSEAGGLTAGDEVRIAGVRVGKVDSIELDGNKVKVGFKAQTDTRLGRDTRADIRVKTILGSMYLDLVPAGSGELGEEDTIPLTRTSSPYNVVDAFSGLAERGSAINTDQLTAALDTLSDLTENTPEEFRAALKGVSALSRNVAKRDAELNELLKNLHTVAGVLDERDQDIIKLMEDADVLFRAVVARRQAVHNLLVSTSQLSQELTTLVRQSRADLKPALQHTANVLAVLEKNQENLDQGIRLLAPFYRVFASTLGNGPWFDTIIHNFPPAP
jgi:phospholipid/cholesterol/gamma-HCH transport system substrate-binding protein